MLGSDRPSGFILPVRGTSTFPKIFIRGALLLFCLLSSVFIPALNVATVERFPSLQPPVPSLQSSDSLPSSPLIATSTSHLARPPGHHAPVKDTSFSSARTCVRSRYHSISLACLLFAAAHRLGQSELSLSLGSRYLDGINIVAGQRRFAPSRFFFSSRVCIPTFQCLIKWKQSSSFDCSARVEELSA